MSRVPPRGARLAVLSALALAACEGYRLVDPGTGDAYFYASVAVTHDDSARYQVQAVFQRPGGGGARRVRDHAIVVDGVRVEPSWTSPTGAVSYQWLETRPADAPRAGTLVVRGPELDDGAAATVPLRLLARGESTVSLAPGEDLSLRVLTAAPPASLERREERWSVNLRDACVPGSTIPIFDLSAIGPVPPEVRIPRSLLPDPLPSPLEVCLDASAGFVVSGAPYPTFSSTTARLVWRVAP